jgi:putative membrane protein
MTRAAIWLLAAGVLLFLGVLISQGLPAVFATLSLAGWGLLLVALFHLLPLLVDAAAIRVLFEPVTAPRAWQQAVLTRWAGESATSLTPGGQIGGPVLMARHLAQRGMPMADAAAAITVSTTLQTLAQIVFALMGVALLGAQASHNLQPAVRTSLLIAGGVLALTVVPFYFVQRRGLFGGLMRAAARFSGKRDWSVLMSQAEAIDLAVEKTYRRNARATGSFALSLIGWVVGTGEVYLVLRLLNSPVSWSAALMLESLGQAIRGAAFAIPGSLGVQEGGYLLLAPLAGLTPHTALALSLAKRTRELLLGLPGFLYLHFSERDWRRRRLAGAAVSE